MRIQTRKYFSSFFIIIVLPLLLLTILSKGQEKVKAGVSVVVIDPGHGGKDPGTVGGHLEEKNVVLDIALRLGDYIQANYPDIKIIYTRKSDVFIPLHKRADIANKAGADLFISIHANSVEQKYVQGTETFVLGQHRSQDNLDVAKKENSVILLEDDYHTTYEGFDPNSSESYIMFELVQDEYKEQSISLANEIQNEFRLHAQRKDRSVKEAGFLVLRRTTMPSVLIETGFLSNSADRQFMDSKSGRDQLAAAIFRAFNAYKNDVEQKSSFRLLSETFQEKPVENEPTLKERQEPITKAQDKKPETELYYSVQIMALKKRLDPSPANFKGLKNVFRQDSSDLSRYFSGKYKTLEEAELQLKIIQTQYSGAFVVAFKNNELISVKKLSEE